MTGSKMASLASGLLARKGEARPATRRPFVAKTTIALLPVAGTARAFNDDIDSPDQGGRAHAGSPPAIVRQLDRLARAFLPPAEAGCADHPRVAFTLRLDHERHLRLRLARAITHHSGQRIVTQALDEYLARLGSSVAAADIASAFPEPDPLEARPKAGLTAAQGEARVRLFTDIADFLAERPRTT